MKWLDAQKYPPPEYVTVLAWRWEQGSRDVNPVVCWWADVEGEKTWYPEFYVETPELVRSAEVIETVAKKDWQPTYWMPLEFLPDLPEVTR